MKNLAASVHARLVQRRAKTGEDFNVLLVRFALARLSEQFRLRSDQSCWLAGFISRQDCWVR